MENFLTIKEEVTAQVVEKKSKFIADCFPVSSVEEAEEKISEIRKKYHDARHHCIAYRVKEENQIIEKASDDGEPSGTAGAPMLAILKNKNLCNILVIVTRYFGGVLLGTGGLVKAYSDATINGIENGQIVEKKKGIELQIEMDYSEFENFKYYCRNNEIFITNAEYSDVVICNVEMENNIKEKLLEDINTKKININNLKVLSEKYIEKSI